MPTIVASAHHSGRPRFPSQPLRTVAANAAALAWPLGNADVLGSRTGNRGSPLVVGRARSEDALDPLVDDQALGAERDGEADDLIESPRADAAHDAGDVPDEAEVADAGGGREHAVDDRVATNAFERSIGALVEPFDEWAETARARRLRLGHAGASRV